MLGVLVGLEEEELLARRFFPKALIERSGVTESGGQAAVDRLKRNGANRLLSFGCAGGLAPHLRVGDVLIPDCVQIQEQRYPVSPELLQKLLKACGRDAEKSFQKEKILLHTQKIVAELEAKQTLYARTGADAVDMESGLAAVSGLPFAVLRVVCDPAERRVPPAACLPLRNGRPDIKKILKSVFLNPMQIPSLIVLGRDAIRARTALSRFCALYPSLKDL